MQIFTTVILCLMMVFSFTFCSKVKENGIQVEQKDTKGQKATDNQYQKELEEIKKSLKGDIKIKLKKDAKGGYSWEITGRDTNEVLKANETLKKRLSD